MRLTFFRLLRLAPMLLLVILSNAATAYGFGYIYGADNASVAGWACDTDNPLQTTEIKIYKGIRLVTVVQTGIYRPDVSQAGFCGGNEFTGFNYAWSASENDGVTAYIHVAAVAGGVETPLNNSPAGPVTFPPPIVAPPTCSVAVPSATSTSDSLGLFRIFAYNVTNAAVVYFPTWGDVGGQDDLVWYPGLSDGNGTWHADVNLANHKPGNSELGTFFTHVYVGSSPTSTVFCAATSWIRTAPPPVGPAWPTAPNNLRAVCSAGGMHVTISWDALNGATSYAPRLNYVVNDGPACSYGWYCPPQDWLNDSYSSTIISRDVTPNQPYGFWVHGRNSGGFGDPAYIGFTCSAPITSPILTSPSTGMLVQLDATRGAQIGGIYVVGKGETLLNDKDGRGMGTSGFLFDESGGPLGGLWNESGCDPAQRGNPNAVLTRGADFLSGTAIKNVLWYSSTQDPALGAPCGPPAISSFNVFLDFQISHKVSFPLPNRNVVSVEHTLKNKIGARVKPTAINYTSVGNINNVKELSWPLVPQVHLNRALFASPGSTGKWRFRSANGTWQDSSFGSPPQPVGVDSSPGYLADTDFRSTSGHAIAVYKKDVNGNWDANLSWGAALYCGQLDSGFYAKEITDLGIIFISNVWHFDTWIEPEQSVSKTCQMLYGTETEISTAISLLGG